jgi:hypothetical protein
MVDSERLTHERADAIAAHVVAEARASQIVGADVQESDW